MTVMAPHLASDGTAAVPPPPAPLSRAGASCDVGAAIAAMATAVQCGDFAGAEALGAAAPLHLALPKHAVLNLRPLSVGAQAAVFTADLAPDCAHLLPGLALPASHTGGGLTVAHPHLVRLLGARLLPPGYQLVLQLEATSMAAELHRSGWRPHRSLQLRLGAQLAAVVAHMHAAGYVHRDIKPANVLLNASRDTARLADLGLAAAAAELAAAAASHAKPTGGFHKQRMVGTLEYMAPEVLLKEPHSPAADVFALAVTINELATGAIPYSDCTRDNPLAHTILEMGYGRQELAAAVAAEGLRPSLPPDVLPQLAELLGKCWARRPEERPSAAEVAAVLEQLASEAEAEAGDGVEAAAESRDGTSAAAASEPMPVDGSTQGLQLWDAGEQDVADAGVPGFAQPEAAASPAVTTATSATAAAAAAAAAAAGEGGSPGPGSWLAARCSSVVGSGQAAAAAAPPTVFSGSYLAAGSRDSMEDFVTVLEDPFGTARYHGCTALGVFDGHRGASAAEYLQRNLRQLLAAQLGGSPSGGGGDLLAAALAAADTTFRAQQDAAWAERLARMGAAAAGPRPSPGSTATLLLTYLGWPGSQQRRQGGGEGQQAPPRQMLAVAHLGDSRVVLCRGGQAVQLTRDHTADCAEERRRVAAAGGACSVRAGGWRVGTAGLQVTRSIGDADLKGQGVSAEAEVAEVELSQQDSFLIAATDGLWDRVSNEDAVALVQDTVKHPGMCAQRLALEAIARGSGDNVAVIVAFLNCDGSTVERVYSQGRLKYSGAAEAAERRKAAAAAAPSADELRDTY
ncbi:Protein kinase and PP2C-like domain-containing protein [Chlorella vulgaris]